MHTRKSVSQKDLVRGKKNCLKYRYSWLGTSRTNLTLFELIEACEAEKKGNNRQAQLSQSSLGIVDFLWKKTWEYLIDILKVSIHRRLFWIGHLKVICKFFWEVYSSGPMVDILRWYFPILKYSVPCAGPDPTTNKSTQLLVSLGKSRVFHFPKLRFSRSTYWWCDHWCVFGICRRSIYGEQYYARVREWGLDDIV